MTGFEGIGDFDSTDPWERYIAHQAAKGAARVRVGGDLIWPKTGCSHNAQERRWDAAGQRCGTCGARPYQVTAA